MCFKKIVLVLAVVALAGTPVFRLHADAPPGVVINELMWMGSSQSSADEWIELRNMGDAAVDVSGWKLTRKSSGQEVAMLTIPSGKSISGRGYFLISNFAVDSASTVLAVAPDVVDSAVSLLNSGLQVSLYDANGVLLDVADDGTGTPVAGAYASGTTYASMARNGLPGDGTKAGSWHTSTASVNFRNGTIPLGTPGAPNENVPPVVAAIADQSAAVGSQVQFDASDAYDPDGDALSLAWDFGDGSTGSGATPSHTYSAAGAYKGSLVASDGVAGTSAAFTVTVTDQPASSGGDGSTAVTALPTVTISELLPSPVDGEEEFIELIAPDADADLAGWTLSDAGGTTYVFPPPSMTLRGTYLVVKRTTSKIALNNDGDSVTLKRPDGSIADTVEYKDSDKGIAYAREGTSWFWTTTPTPGNVNVITRVNHAPRAAFSCAARKRVGDLVECTASDSSDPDGDSLAFVWNFGDGVTRKGAVVRHRFKTDGSFTVRLTVRDRGGMSDIEEKNVTIKPALTGARAPKPSVKGASIVTAVSDVKDADTSTAVRISGYVTAAPNVLGDGLMYVTDGATGVAVRSANALPKLKVGDAVVVSGERRTKSGEAYVYVTAKDGIASSGEQKALEPVKLSAGALDTDSVGTFGMLTGDVTSISGGKYTVDDGSGEASVYIRTSTGMKKPALHVGDAVTVVGIVGLTSGGIRLLPRTGDDIKIVRTAAQPVPAPVVVQTVRRPSWWSYAAVVGALASGIGLGLWRKQKSVLS